MKKNIIVALSQSLKNTVNILFISDICAGCFHTLFYCKYLRDMHFEKNSTISREEKGNLKNGNRLSSGELVPLFKLQFSLHQICNSPPNAYYFDCR